MSRVDDNFRGRVFKLVSQIPVGRLMTYGQIAALCGCAWAAWEVGQIAHFGPSDLPWHRVVNKQGGLASGFVPNGREGQRILLETEGLKVTDDYKVKLEGLMWSPKAK